MTGPDPRFYELGAPISVGALAVLTGAAIHGGDPTTLVRRAAPLHRADGEAVSFAGKAYLSELAGSAAAACFVSPAHASKVPAGCAALVSSYPQAAFAAASRALHIPRRHPTGAPAIHPDAQLEPDVRVGPYVVIGPGAKIGAGTVVGAGAVIGPGVAIGRDCEIGPNAVIGFALIGDRVNILAGAAIGEPGFGAAAGPKGVVDMPQFGRVIIQDGVTLGAGTCVDRGAWEDTSIGENTKIDNMVQIAHNVRMGRNCRAAAFTGISGSVTVGDGVEFGGRAGVVDHVSIGDGAKLAAAVVATKNVPAGAIWAGVPGRPLSRLLRETAWVARLARGRGKTD